uniref:Uncharacterized protein n=1 Tax=Myotis myotis TaxID=51298 RepID=A0A7J7YF93_MYOMY|nr:hypothetical protein mMyoMyo1_011132 [Myotis myotis]
MVRSCPGPGPAQFLKSRYNHTQHGWVLPALKVPALLGSANTLLLAPHCLWGCRHVESVAPQNLHPVRHPHLFPLGQEEPSILGPKNQQGAEERELEEEQQEQLTAVQEALMQDPACLGALL